MIADALNRAAMQYVEMRRAFVEAKLRDAIAGGAEALDVWDDFDGTTVRAHASIVTRDAPPSHPDATRYLIGQHGAA